MRGNARSCQKCFGYGLLCGVLLTVAGYYGLPKIQELTTAQLPRVQDLAHQGKVEPPPPKFEFYTILPEMEVAVPDLPPPPEDPTAPSESADIGQYALQVGSFKNASDADRLKATLILEGVPTTVNTVQVDTQTWYRVRVGPFETRQEMDDARSRLAELGHAGLMTKLRDSDDLGTQGVHR